MRLRRFLGAALLALVLPVAATAAVIGPNAGEFMQAPGSNTFAGFFVADKITDLGDLNAATADISVNGGIVHASGINSGVTFDVFANPFMPGVKGAVQLLISISGSNFSVDQASFGGKALNFQSVPTGLQATFSAGFSDTTDLRTFLLEFSGAEAPDNIQISIAPVPLPAGILLLGTALGGLGVARRFRRS